ncbi:MAG: hypothetical protein ACK5C0_05085 [Candidatus Kapaibacterium sp.]
MPEYTQHLSDFLLFSHSKMRFDLADVLSAPIQYPQQCPSF